MGSDCIVSVIVPVYNTERYLSKCIDSIINQTYRNIEIILVDDGSLDNCGKICDEYAGRDKRIKVMHKKNGGVSSARNCGLDIASGEYVFFVDSDDYVELDAIESFLTMKKSDLIISKGYMYDNGKKIAIQNNIEKNKTVSDAKYKEKIFHDILLGKISPGPFAKIYKRNIIEKYNLRFDTDLKIGEDTIFTFVFCSHATSFSEIDKYTYNYILNSNSVSKDCSEKVLPRTNSLVRAFNEKIWPLVKYSCKNEYCSYVVYLLNCLLIKYIFNKQNNLKYVEKIRIIKELVKKEEYAEPIKNVKLMTLSMRKRILVILLRCRFYFLLRFLYAI